MTCYSLVLAIGDHKNITPESLIKLCRITPTERIEELYIKYKHKTEIFSDILSLYCEFLGHIGKSTKDMIKWLSEKKNRSVAFKSGAKFGAMLYNALDFLENENRTEMLRYLVV